MPERLPPAKGPHPCQSTVFQRPAGAFGPNHFASSARIPLSLRGQDSGWISKVPAGDALDWRSACAFQDWLACPRTTETPESVEPHWYLETSPSDTLWSLDEVSAPLTGLGKKKSR